MEIMNNHSTLSSSFSKLILIKKESNIKVWTHSILSQIAMTLSTIYYHRMKLTYSDTQYYAQYTSSTRHRSYVVIRLGWFPLGMNLINPWLISTLGECWVSASYILVSGPSQQSPMSHGNSSRWAFFTSHLFEHNSDII
jgi:hypothetical protein